jgi:hypothetical protein
MRRYPQEGKLHGIRMGHRWLITDADLQCFSGSTCLFRACGRVYDILLFDGGMPLLGPQCSRATSPAFTR